MNIVGIKTRRFICSYENVSQRIQKNTSRNNENTISLIGSLRFTGDHALIDITQLLSLNPRQVTVRTKSRDNQSSDSNPVLIPGAKNKSPHHHHHHHHKVSVNDNAAVSSSRVPNVYLTLSERFLEKKKFR